ncbi:hypothetical protein NEFER01_1367 [Nematocida sp. LUAm1]|nr:hypothetical protein NEFER02_1100 [Nematocida sp. LUAm2]KAI5178189.1 hypothetical protein NEFER01_1367 [Nematocida sp. LUAm1]
MNRRVFFLEIFGEVPYKVGSLLLHHRGATLSFLCRESKLSKKEVIKAISLFIHFGVVGYYNYKCTGFRYYIKEGHLEIYNYPVYLNHIERNYGEKALELGAEALVYGVISGESLSPESLQISEKLLNDQIFVDSLENCSENRKRLKEETPPIKKRNLFLSLEKIRNAFIKELLEKEIEKVFGKKAKEIFSILLSAYPIPMPFKILLQRAEKTSLVGGSGILHGEGLSLEGSVREYVRYLVGYGAVIDSFEKYIVNYDGMIQKIKIDRILEYYRKELGESAALILSLLFSREYIEDKFIQKHILLEASFCKKGLFSLLSDGAISIQMVPRTTECLPSRSFHLWKGNSIICMEVIKRKLQEKIGLLYLDLQKHMENAHLIGRMDYIHKTDGIFSSLEHLHILYFIFGI